LFRLLISMSCVWPPLNLPRPYGLPSVEGGDIVSFVDFYVLAPSVSPPEGENIIVSFFISMSCVFCLLSCVLVLVSWLLVLGSCFSLHHLIVAGAIGRIDFFHNVQHGYFFGWRGFFVDINNFLPFGFKQNLQQIKIRPFIKYCFKIFK